MTKISRIRKAIRTSPRFTEPLMLDKTPLDDLKLTRGLINPSNWCYINSCIQCLVHCEPFAQVMLHGEHEACMRDFCALCAMRRLTKEVLQEKDQPSMAQEFALNSQLLNPEFQIGTQQDAHEFLTCAISKMVAEEKSGCGRVGESVQQNSEEASKTLLEQVFNFTTKTTITCSKCGTKTETHENCKDLCLQITRPDKEEIETVSEAMRYYFGTEELDGENAYMCDKCNERVKATKTVSLQKGPNVLVICLGRFLVEFDEARGGLISRKLDHFVKFTRTLDVTPHMHDISANEDLKLGEYQYRLSAFSYHVGPSTSEGHYISSVCLPSLLDGETDEIGPWLIKNDDTVAPYDFDKDARVYLLFYTREDSQPAEVSGPRKKKKSKKREEKKKGWSKSVAKEEAKAPEADKKAEPTRRVFLFPRIDMSRRKEVHEEAAKDDFDTAVEYEIEVGYEEDEESETL